MNDLENYKAILDAYFGGGTSTFDTTSGTTNEVLGALNDTNFAAFKSAFIERLKRLASLYSDQESSRSHILETLNLLAYNSNWEGAYAELVAFDFLNSDNHWLLTPIKLSNSANASETLANVPNVPDVQDVQNVNLDGYYEDFGVWFDVKLLADKSGDILDGIITEVKKKLKIPGVVISPQYPLDSDYKLFQHKRHELLEELKNKINAAKQPTFIQSKILSDLAYRLMWNGGVQMTVSTYDPYIHAEMHHKLLFRASPTSSPPLGSG